MRAGPLGSITNPMQRTGISIFTLATLWLAGCGGMPLEVEQAMRQQAAELEQIRKVHHAGVDVLFAQIRQLQLFILAEKERALRGRYARGPQAMRLGDRGTALIYSDPKTQRRNPPSGDPDVDLIALSTNQIITDWFVLERTRTAEELARAKEEFLRLENHIEITERINQAVLEYVESLAAVKGKRNELGKVLLTKLNTIPGAPAIAKGLLKILPAETAELERELPKLR